MKVLWTNVVKSKKLVVSEYVNVYLVFLVSVSHNFSQSSTKMSSLQQPASLSSMLSKVENDFQLLIPNLLTLSPSLP